MGVLAVQHATFVESGRQVEGVSLYVAPGEIVCVLGPEDTGKSLAVRGALGFTRRTAGTSSLFGVDPEQAPHDALMAARARAALCSDQAPLLANLSVRDNLLVPLLMRSRPRAEALAAVEHVLERLDIASFATKRPHELKPRVHRAALLARALLQPVDLLVLDEPIESDSASDLVMERVRGGAAVLWAADEPGRFPATRIVTLERGSTGAW